jgi:DNA-directed RNA polymerase alpha subunit
MTLLNLKSPDKKLKIEIQKRSIDNRTGHIAFQFQIGPFKKSMASTIGSALRRTLLSLSQNVSITTAFGNLYEGNALREDFFELSLNLQKVTLKSSFFPYMGVARLRKTGPAIITAQDIVFEEGLEAVNPYQYICTLNHSYTLDLVLVISSATINQRLNQINPIKPFEFIQNPYFQNQENKLKLLNSTKHNLLFTNQIVVNTNAPENLSGEESVLLEKKSSGPQKALYKGLKKSETKKLSENEINSLYSNYQAQKAPIDIILVDPIYSSIQSCSFEIIQTTKSSVLEYDKLVESGITETDEFLQFVVISRGAIEPVDAIQFAANQLRDDLLVFHTLPHLFASENNLFLTIEKITSKAKLKSLRSNLSLTYTNEIIKNLDIRHLGLPARIELALRRRGFVTIANISNISLVLLKKVGIKVDEFQIIKDALSNFGFFRTDMTRLNWDLLN